MMLEAELLKLGLRSLETPVGPRVVRVGKGQSGVLGTKVSDPLGP
jgi:hypothetical protein